MLVLLHETLKNISRFTRGLENELLTTQENYKTLRESFLHKYGLENLPRTPLTFECRKEIVYSIQHNIRSKEQQCENERLRVEQVVDSITTATKNSEREVISLQKLLSKDLSATEKQMKTLQVKILGN